MISIPKLDRSNSGGFPQRCQDTDDSQPSLSANFRSTSMFFSRPTSAATCNAMSPLEFISYGLTPLQKKTAVIQDLGQRGVDEVT